MTEAAPTTAPPAPATTAATAAPTTRTRPTTTAPPFGEALTPIEPAPPLPPLIQLDEARTALPCPAGLRPVAAIWSIGTATPGTGRLAFDTTPWRSVPDQGRDDRCTTPGPHTYRYTATAPGGPTIRTVHV